VVVTAGYGGAPHTPESLIMLGKDRGYLTYAEINDQLA